MSFNRQYNLNTPEWKLAASGTCCPLSQCHVATGLIWLSVKILKPLTWGHDSGYEAIKYSPKHVTNLFVKHGHRLRFFTVSSSFVWSVKVQIKLAFHFISNIKQAALLKNITKSIRLQQFVNTEMSLSKNLKERFQWKTEVSREPDNGLFLWSLMWLSVSSESCCSHYMMTEEDWQAVASGWEIQVKQLSLHVRAVQLFEWLCRKL